MNIERATRAASRTVELQVARGPCPLRGALRGIARRRPMLRPSDLLFFGADNITDGEMTTIDALHLRVIDLATVKADPQAAAAQAAAWASQFACLVIHLDVDVLAFTEFPIAENTRRQAGLTMDELTASVASLVSLPNWRTLTLTEVNPDHAPDEQDSFHQLNGMLAACLGSR